jgi:uncharacterized protein YjiS (DUF1127 family)
MVSIHWQASRNRPRQHNGLAPLIEAWDHLASTVHEWRRRSRERAELTALDDKMLKDIGLSRADAEFLGNKPFWRE